MDGRHFVVCGLGFGDEGKGSVVDFLCRPRRPDPARAVIRFNGGAQAGHNVLTADGRHHTFAQFGSGCFTPGVRTHLSRFVLVDPLALAAEAGGLAAAGVPDALARLTVDRDALLVTPYHRAANQARETARGRDRHGSCGMGIGETARYALARPGDAPRVADCAAPRTLARSLARLRDQLSDELGPLGGPPAEDLCDAYRAFADRVPLVDGGYLRRLLREGPAVFEGAQGVLLDEWRGFHPLHHLVDHHLRQRRGAAGRGGRDRRPARRRPLLPDPARPRAVRDRGPHPGAPRTAQRNRGLAGRVPRRAPRRGSAALRRRSGRGRGRRRAHPPGRGGAAPVAAVPGLPGRGQLMSRIEPGPERDLDAQERLTGTLLRARPVYSDPVSGCDPARDWPDVFEEMLGAPVVLRSYGPTAAAKRGLQATPTLPPGTLFIRRECRVHVVPAA